MASNIIFGGLIMILLGCGPFSIDKEKQESDSTLNVAINNNDSIKEEHANIIGIVSSNDTVFIDVDYIQYLTGQQAINAAKKNKDADTTGENGKIHVSIPNDYYIVNESKKIRRLKLSEKVAFELIINPDRTHPIIDNSSISFEKIYRDSPFILTISNNEVVKIKELFLP